MAFAALIVLAGLNRETSGLLLLLLFAVWRYDDLRSGDRRAWAALALCVLAFVGVYAGLRVVLGIAPEMVLISEAWRRNTGGDPWNSAHALANNALLMPLWALALRGWRGAPILLKRIALVSIPYLMLLAIFALWNEVRLLMPLWALVMPLALRGLDVSPIGDNPE